MILNNYHANNISYYANFSNLKTLNISNSIIFSLLIKL